MGAYCSNKNIITEYLLHTLRTKVSVGSFHPHRFLQYCMWVYRKRRRRRRKKNIVDTTKKNVQKHSVGVFDKRPQKKKKRRFVFVYFSSKMCTLFFLPLFLFSSPPFLVMCTCTSVVHSLFFFSLQKKILVFFCFVNPGEQTPRGNQRPPLKSISGLLRIGVCGVVEEHDFQPSPPFASALPPGFFFLFFFFFFANYPHVFSCFFFLRWCC